MAARLDGLSPCRSTWFPTARPRTTFAQSFGPCFCAALAASGAAHVFSVAQDAKSAQLSSVAALVIAAMFAGVEPRLSELQKLGAGAKPLIWGSYARWLVESLYAAEVSALSTAWRMPPAFYNRPRAESALMGLFMYCRRADLPLTSRDDAAAATWLARGGRVAPTPRLGRG